MKRRYILYRRKRGGMFYIEDTETRKQESTGTRNRAEATSVLNARNESIRQPHLNLQIAKAYLAGTDSGVVNADVATTRLTPSSKPRVVQPRIAGSVPQGRRRWTLFVIVSFLKRKASICSPALRWARSARTFICANCTTSAFR